MQPRHRLWRRSAIRSSRPPDRGVYRTDRRRQVVEEGPVHLRLAPAQSTSSSCPATRMCVYASMWRARAQAVDDHLGGARRRAYKIGGWRRRRGRSDTAAFPRPVRQGQHRRHPAAPQPSYGSSSKHKPGSGLYLSDDAGESLHPRQHLSPRCFTRPFYYGNIAALIPNDPEHRLGDERGLLQDAPTAARPSAPRTSRTATTTISGSTPNDPNLMCSRTTAAPTVSLNGGTTWSTLYNQPTAEIYQVNRTTSSRTALYGAQQDNSTLIVPSLPLTGGRPDSRCRSGRPARDARRADHAAPDQPRHRLRRLQGTVLAHEHAQRDRSSRTGPKGSRSTAIRGKDLILRFQRVRPWRSRRTSARGLLRLHTCTARATAGSRGRRFADLTLNPARATAVAERRADHDRRDGRGVLLGDLRDRESSLEPGRDLDRRQRRTVLRHA